MPLLRVGGVVVEFLAAVGVADVAVTLRTDGVVAGIGGGDRRAQAWRGGVAQLGREAHAVESAGRGQTGQVGQRGKEIDQLHGGRHASARRDPRARNEQGHAG